MSEEQNVEQFDPETATFEDLEKQIISDWDSAEGDPVEEQDQTPPGGKQVFRREIDLGDGSGKQVFEADTLEGLADALTQAQTHATKKIRELSRGNKVEDAARQPERELTADEKWLLSQELLNDPTNTQKKIIEGLFGMPLEDIRESIAAAKETKLITAAQTASKQFVEAHQDEYFACPENQSRMVSYLDTYKLPPTVESLEKAFNDLNKSGLLKAKPEEAPVVEGAESEPAEQQETSGLRRTVQTPASQPQRRVGSGLSTKGRSAPVIKRTQPTEQELYDMPIEKLEQLSNEFLRSRSGR